MKWYTRDWTEGRLSDAQFDFVQQDYALHVEALREQSPGLAPLLDLDLHDGQVREWGQAGDLFQWRLLVGDLQRGYMHANVEYAGAHVVGGVSALAELHLDASGVEVLYDELERTVDGRCLHRVLLWPEGELWLQFDTASVTTSAATAADRR